MVNNIYLKLFVLGLLNKMWLFPRIFTLLAGNTSVFPLFFQRRLATITRYLPSNVKFATLDSNKNEDVNEEFWYQEDIAVCLILKYVGTYSICQLHSCYGSRNKLFGWGKPQSWSQRTTVCLPKAEQISPLNKLTVED